MRKSLAMALSLVALASTSAHAASINLTAGPQDPQYFDGIGAGQSSFSLGGIAWAGNGLTTSGGASSPLGMGDDIFMSILSGGTETATFSTPQDSLSLYWGEISANNSVHITIDGFTISGAMLTALGPSDTGSASDPNDNELVTLTGFPTPFESVLFSAGNGAPFNFALDAPNPDAAPTPEASTWAMMLMGFLGMGFVAYRKRNDGLFVPQKL